MNAITYLGEINFKMVLCIRLCPPYVLDHYIRNCILCIRIVIMIVLWFIIDFHHCWRWIQREDVSSHTKWKIWRNVCAQNFAGETFLPAPSWSLLFTFLINWWQQSFRIVSTSPFTNLSFVICSMVMRAVSLWKAPVSFMRSVRRPGR